MFDDCMMFHLLTVFPNNAAEQERAEEALTSKHLSVSFCSM
jgi:hypothetical protein